MAPAAGEHEEVVPCDLADKAAVHALCEGVDAIAHFGGVSVERPFEENSTPISAAPFTSMKARMASSVWSSPAPTM